VVYIKDQKTNIDSENKSTATDTNEVHIGFWWRNLREREMEIRVRKLPVSVRLYWTEFTSSLV
jgi:hypothetical protein